MQLLVGNIVCFTIQMLANVSQLRSRDILGLNLSFLKTLE